MLQAVELCHGWKEGDAKGNGKGKSTSKGTGLKTRRNNEEMKAKAPASEGGRYKGGSE
jgi:hypothetical protein